MKGIRMVKLGSTQGMEYKEPFTERETAETRGPPAPGALSLGLNAIMAVSISSNGFWGPSASIRKEGVTASKMFGMLFEGLPAIYGHAEEQKGVLTPNRGVNMAIVQGQESR